LRVDVRTKKIKKMDEMMDEKRRWKERHRRTWWSLFFFFLAAPFFGAAGAALWAIVSDWATENALGRINARTSEAISFACT